MDKDFMDAFEAVEQEDLETARDILEQFDSPSLAEFIGYCGRASLVAAELIHKKSS